MSDDEILMKAQAKLLANRQALGIDNHGASGIAFTQNKIKRHEETLEDVLRRALAATAANTTRKEMMDPVYARLAALNEAEIPDTFRARVVNGKKWPSVTWNNLGGLLGPEGDSSLGGIIHDGKFLTGDRAVAVLRKRMASKAKVVLIGGTRVGKSCSAAAAADGEIRAGATRVAWVNATDMDRPGQVERALGAQSLYLDDIGAELYNAVAESGIASQRCETFSALMHSLSRLSGRRLTITTYFDSAGMRKFYGEGIASRVFEDAEEIRLERRG